MKLEKQKISSERKRAVMFRKSQIDVLQAVIQVHGSVANVEVNTLRALIDSIEQKRNFSAHMRRADLCYYIDQLAW
jgi:hypothetical protein